MSFIQQTIKCKHCDSEMNVSTGTFGGGIPAKCPYCGNGLGYEVISQGWHAKENIPTPVTPMTKIREMKDDFRDKSSRGEFGGHFRDEDVEWDKVADWWINRFQQELASLEEEIRQIKFSTSFTQIVDDVLAIIRQHKQ